MAPVLVGSLLAAAAAGCGSTPAADTHGHTTTTARGHTTTTKGGGATPTSTPRGGTAGFLEPEMKYGTATYGAPDPTTTVPTERGSRPINAANDAGQQVIIAEKGILVPQWLVANVNDPITWTNLSGQPQQVVFDDAPVRSKVIPDLGTFVWTPPGYAVDFAYHVVGGGHARITLQNPNLTT